MTDQLPCKILEDLVPVLERLKRLGLTPLAGQYDAACFGNYIVMLSGDTLGWEITRERGQYILRGLSLTQKSDITPEVFHDLETLVEVIERYDPSRTDATRES